MIRWESVVGAALVGLLAHQAPAATPLEHLRAAPKPRFRLGHTLPPLTRWGWRMSHDAQVELTEHWGYALEMGEANAGLVKELDDPKSLPSRLCALTASDPQRYPLSVLTYRACCDAKFSETLPAQTWCQDADGKPSGEAKWKTWSPEAPDEAFQKAAAAAVGPLKKIQEKAPIAIILNGGEYALSVYGHCLKVWEKDPKVLKAKGERDWFDYISERKARQEQIITDAIRAAFPNRTLYIFYYIEGCPHRRSDQSGWKAWAWDYRPMRTICDLPSTSIYYLHFNSGWTGNDDMLSQALNATAQHLALGDPLSYDWLNAGWTREKLGEKAFSDMEHYTGYLKCYYTAGMVGGVAGYFAYPKGGFDGDIAEQPPSWLAQIMAFGHVHALFTNLEEFLRKGDLLPGPDKHRWSKDLPAYEFPTGDATARVLARKHRERDEWLIAAWAAGGPDRKVTVSIPGLGVVEAEASACGSIYRAVLKDGRPTLSRVDEKGMSPTASP